MAVKILRAELATDPAVRSRFAGATTFRVEHPNVGAVLDSGEHRGLPYLVTEYLGGRVLEDELAEGPLSPDRLRAVLLEALAGLDAAHRAGATHGDLTATTVALTPDGAVKVVDFGLGRRSLPARAEPAGPEASPSSAADDLRAFGLMAAHALGPGTGSDPLRTVIEQAVGSSPAGTFPTAGAMLDALRALPAPSAGLVEPEAANQPAARSDAIPESQPTTAPASAPETVRPTEPAPPAEPVPPPSPPAEATPTTPLPVRATGPDRSPVEAAAPGEPSTGSQPVSPTQVATPEGDPTIASSGGRRHRRPPRARRRWLAVVGILGAVVLTSAVLLRVVGGGEPERARSLTDVPPRVLVPDAMQLRSGLRLAQLNRNRTVAEVGGTKELLTGSRAPVDDRKLLSEHPFRGGASSLWANFAPAPQAGPAPSPTTDVAVTVLKFRSPADAEAVRARWRWQEMRRIEELERRMQDPRYSRRARPGLGSIDVVHFRDPEARRLGSQERGPADFVRHRGTRGQYLFEVVSRQRLAADGTPLPGSVDPTPSVDELLSALAAQFHTKLRPDGAPPTTAAPRAPSS